MAEQEQVETAPSVEEQPEETLNDVLKDVSVEDVAQSFSATPKAPKEAPKVDIPDPSYDPDGFKREMSKFAQNDWEVGQKVDDVLNAVNEMRAERQRNAEQTDISATIEEIQEAVPALKGKNRVVQGLLGAYAQEDQRIAKVWEQRKQNPAAWNKTLNVLKREIAKEFDFQTDPQLAENVKAAKASRDQMATTQKPDVNEKWAKASPDDFARMWDNLIHS